MFECENLFWNSIDLKPPETISLRITAKKPDVIGGNLMKCLDKMYTELNSLNQLNIEAALISRLVYRFKRKLIHDKGFKALQKINHLLHNYLELDLSNCIKMIKDCIYDKKGPSRQLLEYHLINIIRLSSLFHKLFTICLDGGRYFKDRLNSGDFWVAAAFCMAPISRVWSISMHIVKNCCIWYNDCKSYVDYLKSSGTDWLPESFNFPISISHWLQHPPYISDNKSSDENLNEMKNMFELRSSVPSAATSTTTFLIEDLGESVSRESVDELFCKDKSNRKGMDVKETKKDKDKFGKIQNLKFNNSKIKKLILSITGCDDIINFISKEGVMRTLDHKSVTNHLSSEQWKEMKNALSIHVRTIQHSSPEEKAIKLAKAVKCFQYYLYHSTNK